MTNEDWINTFINKFNESKDYKITDVRDREKLLDELRPHGRWIIDGHHIRCNRCNEYLCNTDREGNEIPDNYCPNCGAKMEKEEEYG